MANQNPGNRILGSIVDFLLTPFFELALLVQKFNERGKSPEEKALYRINNALSKRKSDLDLMAIDDLKVLPKEIGNLTQLTSLDISYNSKLQTLPAEIGKLSNLKFLNAAQTGLNKLPPEIGQLTNLVALRLYASFDSRFTLDGMVKSDGEEDKIKSLPPEIGLLTNLEILDLAGNQLSNLPPEIGMLTKLVNLDLSLNKLDTLPPEIGELYNLEELNLSNKNVLGKLVNNRNNIFHLPKEMQNLKNLRKLDLAGNPLPIPPEILDKLPRYILSYYFSLVSENQVSSIQLEDIPSGFGKSLNESKLIMVGQPSVGKTSLVQQILHSSFDQNQTKTEGIEINQWTHVGKSKIKINIWDFGGQEIMHATHQFFLTKRSLYLLVLDSRLTQEENRLEYWLKIIQSFSDESPVLIVGNKIDQHPLDIDRTGLQKKHHNIVGILETSAATGTGIEELKTAITEQVNKLPHVRDLLPETWFTVKTKLEELGRQSNFITHDKYLDLCAENEVNDETSQRTLIGFLHDLGVVLHFQDDPRLAALGILNPQWVTNGAYKIINSHTLFVNKGVLTTSMLDEILDLPEYPRGKRLFIVDMMKRFELCYDIDGNTFLVPDLLPKDEPYTGEWDGALAFKYAYGVLPSSIMSRFIVKMKDFVHQPSTWRSGTIMKKDGNMALVKADFEDRTVNIKVQGAPNTKRDMLSLIRGTFEIIHKSVSGLEVTQQVPHPEHSNLILDYEELIEFEREGVEEFPRKVDGKVIKINVREMLNGVENESQRKEKGVVINNFYSASDGGVIVGRDFSGNLISGDDNQIIQDSYNKIKSADIQPELKETLKQLVEAVATMNRSLPEEQSAEVTEDLGKLVDEATNSKPNKKWYSVSIKGLIKAAENLDKLGEPVINLSRKVLSLLTGGVIK